MDNQIAVIYIVKEDEHLESYLVQAKDVTYVLINGAEMDAMYVQERANNSRTIALTNKKAKEVLMRLYKWHQKKIPKTEGEIKVIMALDAINCFKDSYVVIEFR